MGVRTCIAGFSLSFASFQGGAVIISCIVWAKSWRGKGAGIYLSGAAMIFNIGIYHDLDRKRLAESYILFHISFGKSQKVIILSYSCFRLVSRELVYF